MRKAAVLGGLCALLLGGAWALSAWLTAEVPVAAAAGGPPAPGGVPLQRPAPPPPTLPARGDAPSPSVEVRVPVAAGAEPPLRPTPGPFATVEQALHPLGGPVDAPPDVDSPWRQEPSRELDYAFTLLTRPDAGKVEWGSAAEVFERCVKQAPEVARCREGLLKAQALYLGEPLPVDGSPPFIAPYRPRPEERPAKLADEVLPGSPPVHRRPGTRVVP